MTAYTVEPGNLSIVDENSCLRLYQFGSCVAKHYFCIECGIYPFHQSLSKPDHYRINIGCIEGVDSVNLPFDIFNGQAL